MRVVVQRCLRAEVRIDGATVGAIGRGFMILVGFTDGDSRTDVEQVVKRGGVR